MGSTIVVDDRDAGAGGTATAAEQHKGPQQSFHAYARVLRTHRNFRFLWIAEMVDNVGTWLSYVATLSLASEFSGSSGLAVGGVVLLRFLPSLLLAPVTGVVADRANRVRVLVAAALIDALMVGLMALVRQPSQVGLLYVLLALQFSAAAFYDPARTALVPVLVPASDLHLATTIDSFAWSVTGAVGASIGGVVASRLGKQACFLLDAATYLVAAWCAWQLPPSLGAPDAAARLLRKHRSLQQVELTGAGGIDEEGLQGHHQQSADGQTDLKVLDSSSHKGSSSDVCFGSGGDQRSPTNTHAQQRHQQQHLCQPAYEAGAVAAGQELATKRRHQRDSNDAGSNAPAGHFADVASGPAVSFAGTAGGTSASDGAAGLVRAAASAVAGGFGAILEGWRYLCCWQNADVGVLVHVKSSAASLFGALDILNVKFSEVVGMQLGDASSTLGLIFATVGLGCFVGPVAMNMLVAPTPSALRWGVAASFCFVFVGMLMMLVSQSIYLVLASTFLRAMGSATLWVYSTLLLQKRVPNELLGRISALETALYTVAKSVSSVGGGLAFDVLHMSVYGLVLWMSELAGILACGWLVYAYIADRLSKQPAYQPVSQETDQVDS